MRALVRNKGETIIESDGLNVDWTTGLPFTGQKYFGGPYKLVQNYIAPDEDQEASYEEIAVEEPAEPVVEENEDDYVVINGVRYSKDELRSLLE